MLDTTRLKVRGLAMSRDRVCCTVTGACAAAFSTRSAPSGSPSRLRAAHGGVHLVEATERVGLVAGQLGEHEGDVVAEDVVGAAHADRDHHLERDRLLAAADQVGAHASGDRGQHHVVDGRAVGALDDPQVTEGALSPGQAAQRRELPVEHARGRGAQQVAQRAGHAQRARGGLPRRGGGRARRAQRPAQQVELLDRAGRAPPGPAAARRRARARRASRRARRRRARAWGRAAARRARPRRDRRPCSDGSCRRSRTALSSVSSQIHISHSGRSRRSGIDITSSTRSSSGPGAQ